MKEVIKKMMDGVVNFGRDDEGAQIVEYALIIALVSIALALALQGIAAGGGPFSQFITRVTTCLTTATCT